MPNKIVVVGGHSRNIGKTSVTAEIIRGLNALQWTAIKITQFGHGECAINGNDCKCSTDVHRYAIQTEEDRSGKTDTSRFLVAGAARSIWVRTKQGMLFEAMPSIRRLIDESDHTIIESNSILGFLKPDLYLQVLDYSVADFKTSAKRFMDLADAYVLIDRGEIRPQWEGISLKPALGKPAFSVQRGIYVTDELLQFVQGNLND